MRKTLKGFFIGVLVTTIVSLPIMSFAETTATVTAVFDRIKLSVNGEKLETQTILYNGTTYVPIRDVAEHLGAKIDYDQNTQIADITLNNKVGDNSVTVADVEWENGTYDVVEDSNTVATDPVRLVISNVTTDSFVFSLINEDGEDVISGIASVSSNKAEYADTDIHIISFALEDDVIKFTDTKGLTVSSGHATFIKTDTKAVISPAPVVNED